MTATESKTGSATRTDRLTTAEIRNLLGVSGPCITMVLAGNDAESKRTQLKDDLNNARKELQVRAPGADVDVLLEPLLAPDFASQLNRPEALLILRSRDVLVHFPADRNCTPTTIVGDRFSVRALLSAASLQKHFCILALSQKRTRVIRCTNEISEEIPLPQDFPVNLDAWMQTGKPDHVLDNRSTGGPSTGSMKGVMFGTSTDREHKDENLLHFFAEVDKSLRSLLKDSTDPVVPVAVEHELALYRRVSSYPDLVEPGVFGAPDGLDGGEIHKRALELLDETLPQSVRHLLESLDKKIGSGHASVHIQNIVNSAHSGRVSHLFFQENAQSMGTYDGVRGLTKHTDDETRHPVDLIDLAAHQTIVHGGEAMILRGSLMPNGVPVCALFRYA